MNILFFHRYRKLCRNTFICCCTHIWTRLPKNPQHECVNTSILAKQMWQMCSEWLKGGLWCIDGEAFPQLTSAGPFTPSCFCCDGTVRRRMAAADWWGGVHVTKMGLFFQLCVSSWEDGQRMWTPRNRKSPDSTVFHQGPTPGDFPRLECKMAPSFCSHLPHSFLITLSIHPKSSPLFSIHMLLQGCFWSVNWGFWEFYSKHKHLLRPILGEKHVFYVPVSYGHTRVTSSTTVTHWDVKIMV